MTTHLVRLEGDTRAFCGKTREGNGIMLVTTLEEATCGACSRYAKHWNATRPLPRPGGMIPR